MFNFFQITPLYQIIYETFSSNLTISYLLQFIFTGE